MSQRGNTATVAAIYAAFARGDLETVLEAMDDSVDWVTPATLPWSEGRYRGREGLSEYFGSFAAMLADPTIDPDELIAADDRVIAIGHERGRGVESGRAFEARFVHTWTLREGRVTRMEGLVDTAAITAALSTS